MNMFKKNGGFTLVELIVVIAILAILAAIAVPAYTGYIDKAKETNDIQIVSAINTAIHAATAVNDAEPEASIDEDGTVSITFTGTDATKAAKDFTTYISNSDLTFKYYNTVTITDGLLSASYVKPAA